MSICNLQKLITIRSAVCSVIREKRSRRHFSQNATWKFRFFNSWPQVFSIFFLFFFESFSLFSSLQLFIILKVFVSIRRPPFLWCTCLCSHYLQVRLRQYKSIFFILFFDFTVVVSPFFWFLVSFWHPFWFLL